MKAATREFTRKTGESVECRILLRRRRREERFVTVYIMSHVDLIPFVEHKIPCHLLFFFRYNSFFFSFGDGYSFLYSLSHVQVNMRVDDSVCVCECA